MKIKTIAFDVGGVLAAQKVKSNRGVHEEMARNFHIDLDSWFDAIDTPYGEAIIGKLSKKEALSRIAKNLNTNPRKLESLLKRAYKHHFTRNAELYNLAFKLKRAGYKIMILSDQWPVSKDALINKEDARKFNLVLVSCDIGVRKPSKEFFRLAIKKSKCHPEEILFIDNREWNLKPAKLLGIKTILFKNNKQLIKSLRKLKILK